MISSVMRRVVKRRGLLAFVVGVGAMSIAALPFIAPTPGVSYKVRMVITPPDIPGMPAQGEMVIAGHGLATGMLNRLDLDSVPAAVATQGVMSAGDFVLTDSGRVFMVSPATKTFTEGINGMGGLPPELLAQASLSGVSVNVESLGAGEVMQGYPTQKYRVTSQYGLAIMGQSMNTYTTQEMWIAQLPSLVSTPFDGSIPASMSNGPMKELFEKTLAARKGLGAGTPLKTITTANITGPMNVTTTQTFEMYDIKTVDVDPALMKLPASFTKKP